ncbi:MAG: sugar ABC transporter permease [Betaproteobacteria bacterium]|nr:MAG: sugar ABC transporter permease [Betaproteobacteria bacterium]
MRRAGAGWLLVLPAVALIAALSLYPVAYGIWLSFYNKHAFFPGEQFIGLANYAAVLADEEFWRSLRLGLVYSLTTIALQLAIGTGAALLLNEAFPARGLVRAVAIFPYVVPTVVAVIIWKWLLNNQFGLVNYLLGISVSWFGRDWIMVSLILVSVWQFFPFVLLAVLARLQTIAPELYEAAKVDGANAWRRFLHITVPQLAAVLFVVVLLRSIWMFTKFDTPWLLIQGGGAEPYIRTLPVYTFQRTFAYYEAGRGSAMAVLMFLLLVVAAVVYMRLWRREEQL